MQETRCRIRDGQVASGTGGAGFQWTGYARLATSKVGPGMEGKGRDNEGVGWGMVGAAMWEYWMMIIVCLNDPLDWKEIV